MTLATYADCLEWIRPRWGDVLVPYRLHERGAGDDGAPAMHPTFLRFIASSAGDRLKADITERCYHPQGLPCGTCDDTGLFVKTVERYLYPMARSLERLDREPARRPGHPKLSVVVVTLAATQWDLERTTLWLDFAQELVEAWAVMAIRKLAADYRERPSSVGWVSKSDAQRAAESAA